MDDDTLQKLSNGQLSDEESSQKLESDSGQQTEDQKPKPNYAFLTPSEAGFRETDPNRVSGAPRPQPGMTFTPTGGSVSSINHQINRAKEDNKDPKTAKQSPQIPLSINNNFGTSHQDSPQKN